MRVDVYIARVDRNYRRCFLIIPEGASIPEVLADEEDWRLLFCTDTAEKVEGATLEAHEPEITATGYALVHPPEPSKDWKEATDCEIENLVDPGVLQDEFWRL